MKIISILAVFLGLTFVISCSRDSVDPPDNSCVSSLDFQNDIQPIIQTNCTSAGCHDGGGFGPGNYTTYSGLENVLNFGSFRSRVIDMKDNPDIGMPPNYSSGPIDLTEVELTMVMEWLDAGFPEVANASMATYNGSVKNIIDNTCAYSGCHDGLNGVGNYTSFEGINVDISNGGFFDRVVTQKEDPTNGMPPNYATGPTDLSESEFELILCWIENGYPEN